MMCRIIASRGMGKTKQLMSEAYENNGIFVNERFIVRKQNLKPTTQI